jgi:transposase InsO family protein
LCQLAQVSRASFYRHWEIHEPAAAEMALRAEVQRAALAHRFYGYRRVTALLEREGFVVGVKRVRRIMRQDNLLAVRRRRFVATSDSDHPFRVFPNLCRYLQLSDLNQLWVADLTYLRLQREFVYLAVILDAWSRRVVGWALGRALDHQLTLQALQQAIAARHPPPGLVHHSDRGSQYACDDYVQALEAIGASLSMSRPASPWENGKCESFIKTLKQEEIDARPYCDYEQLQAHLDEFIEQIYNRVRLHSALGNCSPLEFELQQSSWRPAGLSFPRHREIYPDATA